MSAGDVPQLTPAQLAEIEEFIKSGAGAIDPGARAALALAAKLQEAELHATETRDEVAAAAALHVQRLREGGETNEEELQAAAESVLSARSYVLACQLLYVLGVNRATQAHVARLVGVYQAAAAVSARPDTDNLARLSQAVREIDGWSRDRVADETTKGPGASA